jgi:subtilisin family serine protease
VPDSSSRGIFLSYRRNDAAAYAILLKSKLTERFPGERVFMDLDSIEAGRDFAEVIQDALGSCVVLVALIGRQWVTVEDEQGRRRLHDPDDLVRLEVATALERDVRVIPVLVDGAKAPRREQLPSALEKLARLNALELSNNRFAYDAEKLLDLIEPELGAGPGVSTVRWPQSAADADAPISTHSHPSSGEDARGGLRQKSPGQVRSNRARSAAIPPEVGHVVSRLLGPGADQYARQKLVYSLEGRQSVLVELNLPAGAIADDVRGQFRGIFRAAFEHESEQPPEPLQISSHYMRCLLTPDEVFLLATQDAGALFGSGLADPTIYRIWPDFVVHAHIDQSLTTIKSDAAARTYGTSGEGIIWAVLDSGIDQTHPHFAGGTVTDPAVAHMHRDFTGLLTADGKTSDDPAAALADPFGHGTHVAGIIAGAAPTDPGKILMARKAPTSGDLPSWVSRTLAPGRTLSGMAPKARLVSLRVLNATGNTASSVVIAALARVRALNDDGRRVVIHGVNLSIGYDWYPDDEVAAGQSPLCRELDLLVGTGVVAVVSAGNAGAGGTVTGGSGDVFGRLSTITDPGNAIRAITVGSTHRSQPHIYGVAYTSSKGPTLDGRPKPDLIAPGERITSAATGALINGIAPLQSDQPGIARYVEDSGTSMAAAHVSGAIAAFLSVKDEYIGQPDDVKQLFLSNATSLGRLEFFQGAGLVDLMRTLSNT